MAFRTLGEGEPDNTPTPRDIEDVKNLLGTGDPDTIAAALTKLGAPEDLIQKIKDFQPLMSEAIDDAIDDLCEQARLSIVEQQKTGKPGQAWKSFIDAVRFYFHLDEKDRLETLLLGRIIYLLVACIQEIGDGEPVQIDPMTYDYPTD